MPGLVPGIHEFRTDYARGWPGQSPAMTVKRMAVPSLDREAGAAAARGGDVRVVDLELGADQLVDEVDLGAANEAERDRIDHYLGPVALDHNVVRRRVLHQVEAVLEARAATALDADAHQRRVLGPQNLRN